MHWGKKMFGCTEVIARRSPARHSKRSKQGKKDVTKLHALAWRSSIYLIAKRNARSKIISFRSMKPWINHQSINQSMNAGSRRAVVSRRIASDASSVGNGRLRTSNVL